MGTLSAFDYTGPFPAKFARKDPIANGEPPNLFTTTELLRLKLFLVLIGFSKVLLLLLNELNFVLILLLLLLTLLLTSYYVYIASINVIFLVRDVWEITTVGLLTYCKILDILKLSLSGLLRLFNFYYIKRWLIWALDFLEVVFYEVYEDCDDEDEDDEVYESDVID